MTRKITKQEKISEIQTIRFSCNKCLNEFASVQEALDCFKSHIDINICVACFKALPPSDNDFWGNRHLGFGCSEFVLECDFGSSHDTEKFKLTLCDECLDKYLSKKAEMQKTEEMEKQ